MWYFWSAWLECMCTPKEMLAHTKKALHPAGQNSTFGDCRWSQVSWACMIRSTILEIYDFFKINVLEILHGMHFKNHQNHHLFGIGIVYWTPGWSHMCRVFTTMPKKCTWTEFGMIFYFGHRLWYRRFQFGHRIPKNKSLSLSRFGSSVFHKFWNHPTAPGNSRNLQIWTKGTPKWATCTPKWVLECTCTPIMHSKIAHALQNCAILNSQNCQDGVFHHSKIDSIPQNSKLRQDRIGIVPWRNIHVSIASGRILEF